MSDLDSILSVIENPARRQILEALVREPHYPLQLSRELGISQQAGVKHLKVLEENGLVESYTEKSDLKGPQRRKYYPIQTFSVVVDMGPNLFSAELISREQTAEDLVEKEGSQDVSELRDRMKKIEDELDMLNNRREELLAEKEKLLQSARETTSSIPDYMVRKIIHEFILHPDCSMNDIAKMISVRDDIVLDSIREWMSDW